MFVLQLTTPAEHVCARRLVRKTLERTAGVVGRYEGLDQPMDQPSLRIVSTLRQTCLVAPSQWEGHLRDGRMYHVWYRHGHLWVHESVSPTEDVMDAVRGPRILDRNRGDLHDSYMDEATMVEETASVLDFTLLRRGTES